MKKKTVKKECKLFLRRISDGHVYSYSHVLAREPGFQVINESGKVLRPALRERARLKTVMAEFGNTETAVDPDLAPPNETIGFADDDEPDPAVDTASGECSPTPDFDSMKKDELLDYALTCYGERLNPGMLKKDIIASIHDIIARAEQGVDA
ncbi:MAG: hypothetical protein EOM20_10480 [Spartobacteria bacterium]|nr:hypothetical protein [Spartobacteria bacterium]